jgi:sortase A
MTNDEDTTPSRRSFLRGAGLVGATVGLGGLIVVVPGPVDDRPRITPGPQASKLPGNRPLTEPVEEATEALVEQMLAELRSGARIVDNPNAGAPQVVLDAREGGLAPLGSIAIPSVELDVEFASGVYDEVVARGPGHWPGTPLPGTPGNAVLSGHRTTFTKPFADLDRLVPGDEIRSTLGPRDAVIYEVSATTIVPEADYVDFILRPPANPDELELTLFACHPKGQRTHRIIVQARAQSSAGRVIVNLSPTQASRWPV